MTPDIHVMHEVPATVNVHGAECSWSDVHSDFFPNNSPYNLLNDCITKTEQIAMVIRISNEQRSSKIGLNLI